MIDTSLVSLKYRLELLQGLPSNGNITETIEVLKAAIEMRAYLDNFSLLLNDLSKTEANPPPTQKVRLRCAYCDWSAGVVDVAVSKDLAANHVANECLEAPAFKVKLQLDEANEQLEDARMMLMHTGYTLSQKLAQLDISEEELNDIDLTIEATGEFDAADLEEMTNGECIEYLSSRLKDLKKERDELAEKVEKLEDQNVLPRDAVIRKTLNASAFETSINAAHRVMNERIQAHRALTALDEY